MSIDCAVNTTAPCKFRKKKKNVEIAHVWAPWPTGGAHKKKSILNSLPLQGKEKRADRRLKAT